MCIICNCGEPGHDFLHHDATARRHMEKAAEFMLACSAEARDRGHFEAYRRYDMTHKRMVKLMREWNALEHFRENAPLG